MATIRVWERWRLDCGAQHAILSRRSTALHIPRDDRYLPHTPAAGVPMRPLPCTFVAALCTAPLISLVAQEPRGVLVPVGALVKAESAQSGKTTEGTVLAWRGDTLVMRAAEGGDTVRIAAAALKKLRIAESPTVWRHTSPSDINFFASVAVPRPGDADRSSGRSEEHTSELQSLAYLVCRLLLEKKKQTTASIRVKIN